MPLVGDLLRLNLQLFDGSPSKFVRAFLFNALGNPLTPPFVNLTHIGNGLYINNAVFFPFGTNQVKASYTVYNDALYQQVSRKHSDAIDVFNLEADEILIVNQSILTGTIEDGSLVGSILEDTAVVGSLVDGSLSGVLEEKDTFVGELLENNDDLVPGSSSTDGTIEGEVLC